MREVFFPVTREAPPSFPVEQSWVCLIVAAFCAVAVGDSVPACRLFVGGGDDGVVGDRKK